MKTGDFDGDFEEKCLTKNSTQVTAHAMEMPGKRYDIGDLESYEKVKQEYRGLGGNYLVTL